jgi:hypothetical protein
MNVVRNPIKQLTVFKMTKRQFTPFERYAIWKWHEERCWLCSEPLSYKETTVDHFFPEELLLDDIKRRDLLKEYGLTDENFNINGFENWLPSHGICNQKKSTKITKFIPGNAFVLETLISKAGKVKQTVDKLSRDRNKDKIFLPLLNALELETISFDDLLEFIKPLSDKENIQIVPKDLIILSGGYWVYRDSIAREGLCTCENEHCVDSNEKMYCYFSPLLSSWVIQTGLYYKCYDELITCPRCKRIHKRGHIGRVDICGLPYANQELQTDN